MSMNDRDERFLRMAIAIAARSRAEGDAPYGSLLVNAAGEVLAEDHNTVLSGRDITAHPELKLARWAARELSAAGAGETTMYTSCQPCPMCASAIARAGLGRVVYALASDQLQALQPAGVGNPDAAEVSYDGPALFDEARVPVEGYYG
jgi:tRNA(Arg) A34 adenosine deaminase TadA